MLWRLQSIDHPSQDPHLHYPTGTRVQVRFGPWFVSALGLNISLPALFYFEEILGELTYFLSGPFPSYSLPFISSDFLRLFDSTTTTTTKRSSKTKTKSSAEPRDVRGVLPRVRRRSASPRIGRPFPDEARGAGGDAGRRHGPLRRLPHQNDHAGRERRQSIRHAPPFRLFTHRHDDDERQRGSLPRRRCFRFRRRQHFHGRLSRGDERRRGRWRRWTPRFHTASKFIRWTKRTRRRSMQYDIL